MVIASRKLNKMLGECPHCGSNFVTWDGMEKEPYSCTCGWRKALRISSDQAKNHFTCERKFWLNLFASENDEDLPQYAPVYENRRR